MLGKMRASNPIHFHCMEKDVKLKSASLKVKSRKINSIYCVHTAQTSFCTYIVWLIFFPWPEYDHRCLWLRRGKEHKTALSVWHSFGEKRLFVENLPNEGPYLVMKVTRLDLLNTELKQWFKTSTQTLRRNGFGCYSL